MKTGAIGILASSLGGLSVVRELKRVLPGESLVYYSDTCRAPYGERSSETVYRCAIEGIRFLLSKRVKLIISAGCTLSAVAAKAGESLSVPYIGLLEPCAAMLGDALRVGFIGSDAAVRSSAFERAAHALSPAYAVTSVGGSLLSACAGSFITEAGDPVLRAVAERVLSPFKESPPDALVLGCPLHDPLRGAVTGYIGGEVRIISASEAVAQSAAALLTERDIGNYPSEAVSYRYYVTDPSPRLSETSRMLLGEDISRDVEVIEG